MIGYTSEEFAVVQRAVLVLSNPVQAVPKSRLALKGMETGLFVEGLKVRRGAYNDGVLSISMMEFHHIFSMLFSCMFMKMLIINDKVREEEARLKGRRRVQANECAQYDVIVEAAYRTSFKSAASSSLCAPLVTDTNPSCACSIR